MMYDAAVLRRELEALLRGGQAHADLQSVLAGIPVSLIHQRVERMPYTLWQLVEHMRITQRDILDFIRKPDYEERAWPAKYWPPEQLRADAERWNATLLHFYDDLEALVAIVYNPKTDFFASMRQGHPYTILREIIVAASHNAHHAAQVILLRRALGIWPD